MARLLAWIALNLAASVFLLAALSDILLAKGSDALGSGIVLFPARLRAFPGGAWIRSAAGFVGLACLLAAGHGVTVGTKNDRVELGEYLGPAPIRIFASTGPEDRLSSRCEGLFLTVAASASQEGRVFLGSGPWRLPGALCRHPLLQPVAPLP